MQKIALLLFCYLLFGIGCDSASVPVTKVSEEKPKQVDCENKANPTRKQNERSEEAVQLPQATSDASAAPQKDSDAESPKIVILGWKNYSAINWAVSQNPGDYYPESPSEVAVYIYNGEEIGKGYEGLVAMMERLKQLPKGSEIVLYQNYNQGQLYFMGERVNIDMMPPFRTTPDYWNAFVRLIQDRDFQTWEMPQAFFRLGIPTDRFASEQEFIDKFPDWREREREYAIETKAIPTQPPIIKAIFRKGDHPKEVPTEIIGPLIRVNYTLAGQDREVRFQK